MKRGLGIAHLVLASLAGTPGEAFAAGLCSALRDAGIDSVIVPCRDEDDAAAALAPALALGRFDAVHAHGAQAACHAAALLRDWPLLPVIATLHDAPPRGWRQVWRLRQALRAMDEVTAVSMPLARRHAWLAGRAIAVTPPGVSLFRSALPGARRPLPGDPFRFALFAPGGSGRALGAAVQACSRLVAQGLSVALHVAVPARAGEAAVRIDASRPWLSIEDNPADPAAFLAGKHALLLPGAAAMQAPALLVEAMAAGLPAVLCESRAARDAAGAAALYARPRDSRDMAWQMARVTLDELLWHRLSRAGRQRALRHGTEAVAARFAARYRRMLAQQRGGAGLMFAR